jgi:hypothetical protein
MVPVAIRLHGRSEIKIYENNRNENFLLVTSKHNNYRGRLRRENTFSLFQGPLMPRYPCKLLATRFRLLLFDLCICNLVIEPIGEPISPIDTFLSHVNVDMELLQCVDTKESDLHMPREGRIFYFSY